MVLEPISTILKIMEIWQFWQCETKEESIYTRFNAVDNKVIAYPTVGVSPLYVTGHYSGWESWMSLLLGLGLIERLGIRRNWRMAPNAIFLNDKLPYIVISKMLEIQSLLEIYDLKVHIAQIEISIWQFVTEKYGTGWCGHMVNFTSLIPYWSSGIFMIVLWT